MATNRTRRGRNRRAIPADFWNLLLCRPLENPFSQFYDDKYAHRIGAPTLSEVFTTHEATIRTEWERSGKRPDRNQLKAWGIG